MLSAFVTQPCSSIICTAQLDFSLPPWSTIMHGSKSVVMFIPAVHCNACHCSPPPDSFAIFKPRLSAVLLTL